METYKDLVERLFQNKSSEIIANSSPEHAAILYQAIFTYAQKEIFIFCDSLKPSVFDNDCVVEKAKAFLSKNNTILHIGVTQHPDTNGNFLNMLKSMKKNLNNQEKDRIRVVRFPRMKAKEKFVNFSVMDSCGYRYEPDSTRCCAIASANDESFASELRGVL